MKVAIIHEWLTVMGGADRVVQVIHDVFPSATVFALVHNRKAMPEAFRDMDVRTSFVQRLPFALTHHRCYLPLYPLAVEQFDLSQFDVIISSSHCCAHGVIVPPEAFHLCYCYTPIRYAWHMYHQYQRALNPVARAVVAPLMNWIRQWDYASAQRVDKFVAISNAVRQRIRTYYRRTADVLFPPVDVDFFRPDPLGEIGDYYFIMSRHVPYKKVDLAIKAFNALRLPLVVAGAGPETRRLMHMAGPTIKFLGRISNDEARSRMARCRAFIFPQDEDFGLTAVEAQACGRPVIAYAEGGALDTVIGDVTGSLFFEHTAEALADAVSLFRPEAYNSQAIRRHAESFNVDSFKHRFRRIVTDARSARASAPGSVPQPTGVLV